MLMIVAKLPAVTTGAVVDNVLFAGSSVDEVRIAS